MEMLLMWIISAISLVPMLIISIVLLTGRGGYLVAGYNTMKPSEKAKWNEKALCRATGVLLLVFALLLAGAMVAVSAKNLLLFWLLSGLGVLWLITGVVYLNKSTRFKMK